MLTKTKTINKKKNDLETNHSFSIPKNVQNDINEKGFHLYNWIGEQDVKQSIERDFLKLLSNLGLIGAFILIIPTVIMLWTKNPFAFTFFGFVLGSINVVFLIYLLIISFKRSSILRKNSYVLITDSSVSINGNIRKLENNKIISNQNLKNIGDLFEEEIFKESNIYKTKKGFTKQVTDKLKTGFTSILRMGRGSSRNSGQLVLLLLALYSIYALSLGLIYFIGILFIWIFGNIISLINKQILLKTGHEITTINDYFENIDKDSKELIKEKDNLSTLLNQAIKNDWKDSLLLKINSGVENINKNASGAVNTSIKLKYKIKESKYKEMFNFSIYNSWIKKQIHIPLKKILDLLQKNLDKLKENEANIELEIQKTTDESFKGPLVASKVRTQMRIKDIEKHIKGIEIYINKLK